MLSEAASDSSPANFQRFGLGYRPGFINRLDLSAVAKEAYQGKSLGYSQNEWTLDLFALLRDRGELIAYHGSPVFALHGNGANAAVFHQGRKRLVHWLHAVEGQLPPQGLVAVPGREGSPALAQDKVKDFFRGFALRLLQLAPGLLRVFDENVPKLQSPSHIFCGYDAPVSWVGRSHEVEERGNLSQDRAL